MGVDQNIVSAVHIASSKYVWALGARRIILPEMLEKIYKILSQSNLDLLVLNDLNPTFSVPESKAYHSAHHVFRELNRNLTGLGFQVLPLEAWKLEVAKKYAGTDWTVFGVDRAKKESECLFPSGTLCNVFRRKQLATKDFPDLDKLEKSSSFIA